MNQPAFTTNIALTLLKRFTLSEKERAVLAEQLRTAIDLAIDDRMFKKPLGKKEKGRQIAPLKKALERVRAAIEAMDPAIFRQINRQLIEGDIPLLDHASCHDGPHRSSAPHRIAEVLFDLSGALIDHIDGIPMDNSTSGPNDDRTRFLAFELASIYELASKKKAVRSTEWDGSKLRGPFFEFVSQIVVAAGIKKNAEWLVRTATEKDLLNLQPILLSGDK